MNPLVSVMIPYYNDEKFLRESIDSVLSQTYTKLELILINHACTDSSREIAHSYDDERIMHIDLDINLGAGGGLIIQRFMNSAKGEYLKLFCADDMLLPNALEILVKNVQEQPGIDMLFGGMICLNELEDKSINFPERFIPELLDKASIIKSLSKGVPPFAFPTVFMKREVALKAFIHPVLVYLADVQLWISLALQDYNLVNITEPICYYRWHSEQISSLGTSHLRSNITKFEHLLFTDIIFDVTDPEIIKIICDDSPYLELIDKADKSFYPFIIAHRYLYFSENAYDRFLAFQKISEMFKSEELREEINRIFSYNIGTLRALYRSKEFFDSLEESLILVEKKQSLGKKILKAMNPFRYWKNYKYWKNRLRTMLGIQKRKK